jgi:hypothetical protein
VDIDLSSPAVIIVAQGEVQQVALLETAKDALWEASSMTKLAKLPHRYIAA